MTILHRQKRSQKFSIRGDCGQRLSLLLLSFKKNCIAIHAILMVKVLLYFVNCGCNCFKNANIIL